MGPNLPGRGALVTLDAGLCDLAVSQKCCGKERSESKFGPCFARSHPTPCFGIAGHDQQKDRLEYQKE